MYRLISTPLFVIQVGEHDSLTDLQLFLEANRHSDIYLNSNSSSISSLLYFNTPNPPSSHILFSNDTVIIQNPARLKSIATDCLAVFDTSLNLFEDSAILLSTKLLSTYPGPPNLINLVKHALDEGDCSTPDHLVFYNHPKSKTGISHAFVGDGILIGGLRTPQMMLEALDAFTYKGDTFSWVSSLKRCLLDLDPS